MWALLVDDDLATVRTLRAKIDWQKFGFADAREAYNVNGAIRLIEEAESRPNWLSATLKCR